MKYKFLEHTADAKMKAYGKSLDEAFKNSALGMFAIMTDIKKIKPKIKKTLTIKTKKKESLLYDFLEGLLFLVDTEGFLLSKVSSLKIKKNKKMFNLKAAVYGDIGDKYEVHTQIKAITYSDMFIKETKRNTVIQLVVDI